MPAILTLPSWIHPFCTKLWLKLFHSDSKSFILTQLDDGSHLQFFHLAFNHSEQKNFTHSFSLNLMMAAILNSAILHSAILNKTLTQTNSIWLKLLHSHSIWWWQPSSISPSWIQPSYLFLLCSLTLAKNGSHHLHKKKLTHNSLPTICTKNFTHSFWLNLMMAAVLNSDMLNSDTAILDSDTLLSSLRFTQKHSHSTLTLNLSISIWLKLIPSHVTWWWQPSQILPSWIQLICTKKTSLIYSDSTWWWQPSWILPSWILPSCIQPFCTRKTSLIHSVSPWWWQPSWILSSWIQPFCTKLWLRLIQSDSNSFILTQLDDGRHLEFCHVQFHHLAFSNLSISSQTP